MILLLLYIMPPKFKQYFQDAIDFICFSISDILRLTGNLVVTNSVMTIYFS